MSGTAQAANPITALYADDPAAMMANMRGYLQQTGMPMTTENLNRLQLAIAQQMNGGEAGVPALDAAVERTMTPPRGSVRSERNSPTQPPQAAADGEAAAAATNNAERAAMEQQVAEQPGPTNDPVAAAVAAQAGETPQRDTTIGGRARTALPRAQVIDENDPTAGMHGGAGATTPAGRMADETGVDQQQLGMALLAPLAAAALLPGASAGAAGAAGLAPRMMPNITLQQQVAGRLAGPQAALPPAAGAAPAIAGPPNVPLISGPSAGAARMLPAPQPSAGRQAISQGLRQRNRRVSETAGRSRRDNARDE